MPYRLALFDFDGTLADSLDWFLGIFDQVADRYGYRRLGPGDRERLRGMETPPSSTTLAWRGGSCR